MKGAISISILILIVLTLTAVFFLAGCRSMAPQGVNDIIPEQERAAAADVAPPQPDKKAEAPSFKAFFVYTDDNSKLNHFAPSGWMGDTADIKFSGSYQQYPKTGKSCLRITYLAKGAKEWIGVYWQQPANNWGEKKGGYDLRGAKALTFWARGERGGEIVSEFKMGGITGKYSDSDVAWTGPVKLTKEWVQYSIDLKDKDLRYINGGFCFSVMRVENPSGCTFYLDDIKYE